MKNTWILCVGLCAGLAGFDGPSNGWGARQDEVTEDLETVVLSLQSEVEELREEVEESRRVTRETVAYLNSVSKTAAEMSKTLDSVEAKGFTAGINPSSRETLLAGWRSQLAALQKNVPSLEKEASKAESGRGRRR